MGFWDKYRISPVGKVVLGAIGISALSRVLSPDPPTVIVVRAGKPKRQTGKKSRKERLKQLIREAEEELAKED